MGISCRNWVKNLDFYGLYGYFLQKLSKKYGFLWLSTGNWFFLITFFQKIQENSQNLRMTGISCRNSQYWVKIMNFSGISCRKLKKLWTMGISCRKLTVLSKNYDFPGYFLQKIKKFMNYGNFLQKIHKICE